ncbi:rCG41261, isoform CRA_b [Rattus norvegicus]|uniref:RCG41261, isoform CRA_b n=1 Tax=Rattus norvegicus TaxID=10116 RepID=A6KNE5_RAT|nr:rCG41261, isoform CRA_b [Rattus norvegicus]
MVAETSFLSCGKRTNFSICSASEVETNPLENTAAVSTLLSQARIDGDRKFPGSAPNQQHSILSNEASINRKNRDTPPNHSQLKCNSNLEITIPKSLKLKDSEKVDEKQLVIDAGHKRFGAVSCNICGMLYTASNPEDETQHLLFHNQFISAVKYVVLLINHHECGSEEEFITSFFEYV